MKILFLASSADLTGAETCLLRLITSIKINTNNEVFVINTEEGLLNENLRAQNIKVYISPSIFTKKIYKLKEIKQLLNNILFFRKIILHEKPNIIHAFTLPLARRAYLFKKIGITTPIIGTVHDEFTIENFGKKKTKFLLNSINTYYSKLISVSIATKDIAIKTGVKPGKIEVIYNGVPISFKSQMTPLIKQGFILGCFGRITYSKGQHILLEAINQLKDQIKDLKCLIIGKPPLGLSGSVDYYNGLKKYVADNDLNSYVEFIDWSNNIAEYFEKINIYILCSSKHDPFPTVNLEAMTHHKAVIAVNTGGSKEQVVDNVTGFIINPNNSIELSNKILYLYENPLVLSAMGEAGYKRVVNEFSMEKYTQKHLELYQKVINREI
jgi:glycosyltransferase involved in cell wall biosynthesis